MQGGPDAAREVIDALVEKAQVGDSVSLAGLYEHFYGMIFRYVSFKTGDTAESEDITEEVFLRMLESISKYKFKGPPFSSWLFRIAHNLVVDYFRKKSRQKTSPLEDAIGVISASSYDIDRHMDLKLSLKEVNAAMGELTKLQREVISLRFAAGLSVGETAQAMGKKENAVKALQHAAIKKLRSVLQRAALERQNSAVPMWSP